MQVGENIQQPVLIIAGMHRSGTSLTASLLQSAGVDVGQHLLGKDIGNPKGHFENLDFVNFHQDILRSTGICEAGWTLKKSIHVPEAYLDSAQLLIEKNASHTQPWAWKDPRTTLFLDFWLHLVPEATFVFVYRSPWEVLDSLYRRGDEIFHRNPQFALDLWTHYNQVVLDFYHRFPDRCFLTHLHQITNDPTTFIQAVNKHLSLALDEPQAEIYDASLLKARASYAQRSLLIQRYFPDAYVLYQQLNSVANFSDALTQTNQDLISPTAWLLNDWLEVRGLTNQVAALQQQLSSSQTELTAVTQDRQQLQAINQNLQDANHTLQSLNQTLQEDLSTYKATSEATFKATLKVTRQLQEQLQEQLQKELEHAYAAIAAMQTSKFWKLRTQWLQLKQRLHLKE